MRIVLLGGGGHASDVLGTIEAITGSLDAASSGTLSVAGFVADVDVDRSRFAHRGIKHLGSLDELPRLDVSHYIAAVGYPQGRRIVAARAEACGLVPLSIVHPRAWVSEHVSIGAGCVIFAGACISPGVTLASHCMISNGALLGHDCKVASYVSVMPGAAVSGDTHLHEGCMIGSNATVIEKRTVGAWSMVGAGAVVTADIPAGVTAKGVPARY